MIFHAGIALDESPLFPPASVEMTRLKFVILDPGSVNVDDTVTLTGDFLSFCGTDYILSLSQFTKPEFVLSTSEHLTCDINSDGVVEISDVVYLINYLFRNVFPPVFLLVPDVNTDCQTTIADAVYPINYLFQSGSMPRPGSFSMLWLKTIGY
ncbi:MAG: dockerin type I domain-containing protein [Candidatus Zixiibacteriota bacterium]